MPPEKAMYVAPQLCSSWLRTVQRKLHARSVEQPGYVWRKLWGLVTDHRNLRVALARVARNMGARTAGVDGLTVRRVLQAGAEQFLGSLRAELRTGAYRPSPVRRVLIPKAGQLGKYRALGIPTVKDRVVQAAVKNILEPVFEADFYPVSYGFRPGRSVHGALEHLRILLRPSKPRKEEQRRLPYQWAIEGDIKGCFDNIDHHNLMVRVRRRVADAKVNRLVVAFLKAGVLSEDQVLRTRSGTPQGGILSPLLANIALSAIEERYARQVWPRHTPTTLTDATAIQKRASQVRRRDRAHRPILFPIRYADDFIILVSVPPGPQQQERAEEVARQEKAALTAVLKEELHLELSETKTLVTPVTRPLRFLGHHVRVRIHPSNGRIVSTAVIPKDRSQRLREQIKDLFRRATIGKSLANRLLRLNRVLRGWGNFYRHAWGAKHVFVGIDQYVWWTIYRWLKKKHHGVGMNRLVARYGWRKASRRGLRWGDGKIVPVEMGRIPVHHFKLGWMRPPDFANNTDGKPGAQRKGHAGFGTGRPETT
jgi:RNA-directed DNA polymerase